MSEAHVVVEHLVKTYPGAATPSVNDVSFSLPHGEMLALLGPSGCGKTTMLRMIAGLVEPTSGAIRLEGREISGIPVYKRNMGMVFQAYALFPHMTVAENVGFGLEMRGVAKSDRGAKVARALDMVKLSHLANRRPSQLSGGQQQRCAIARSLVIEPSLLLLDEPLSNLDAKLREEMRDEIRDIQLRTGVTAIFVTHDQDEALSMADRMAVMSDGILEQIGPPAQVFDHPATPFVASFIGEGTFVEGRVIGTGLADVEGFGTIAYTPDTLTGDGHAKLLLRPHRLTVSSETTGQNVFNGIVEHVVYRGQTLSLKVKVGETVLRADVKTHAGVRIAVGERIALRIAPDDVTIIGANA